MSHIITILFALIVIGVILYLVNRIIPMDGTIKLVINCMVALLVIAWLLHEFGLLDWAPK